MYRYSQDKNLLTRAGVLFNLLVALPFKFAMLIGRIKTRDWLFVLPGLLAIVFLGFVFVRVFAFESSIKNRYRTGAQAALVDGNDDLAKVYFQRLANEQELNPTDQFQWAIILDRTGETDRANEIYDELAPSAGEKRIGLGPVHRMKALKIASSLEKPKISDGKLIVTKTPAKSEKLNTLLWHLKNSNDQSQEIQQAWAAYYMAIGDVDSAVNSLGKFAESNPELYLSIAKIYEKLNRAPERNKGLAMAQQVYHQRLVANQLDHDSRIALADIMIATSKFGAAESLLVEGFRLKPDQQIRAAMANYYVVGYDFVRRDNGPILKQMELLSRAAKLNPDSESVAYRLKTIDADDQLNDLLDAATDSPTSVTHFILSDIYQRKSEFERANFHLSRSISLTPKFSKVISNLARMLANEPDIDLSQAHRLANAITSAQPSEPQFHEAFAYVLLKQESWAKAKDELLIAAQNIQQGRYEGKMKLSDIYKNLAMAFGKLEQFEQSNSYAEQARQASSQGL